MSELSQEILETENRLRTLRAQSRIRKVTTAELMADILAKSKSKKLREVENPTLADVERITRSYLRFYCVSCQSAVEKAVLLRESADEYEDDVHVCEKCLQYAVELMGAG